MKDKAAYKNRDKQWSELGYRLREAAKRSDWQRMESIYCEQASILRKEKRNAFQPLKEAMRCSLMHEKSQGIKRVTIMTSKDDRTCPICSKLEGQSFSIGEALEKMPLPVKCQEDYCRCVYGYSMK